MKFFNIIPSEGDRACLLLYGPIGTDEKVSDAQVVAELLSLERTYKSIDVRINSTGGEVFSGIAIFNALRNSKADIRIYVDGVAASIAAIIALCGKPLHMSQHSRLMLHQVSGSAYGTASELRRTADYAEQIQDTLASMIAERCSMSVDDVKARFFSEGDHWLTAQEALEMKLCDSIFDIEGEQPSADATTDDIYQFYTNRLNKPKQKDKNMAFIDDLKARPSFKDAADENALMQQISHLENEAAKVSALEAKVTELSNKLSESTKAAHTAYLNQAVSDGKITKEQIPSFENLLKADEASTKALIDSMPKKITKVMDVLKNTPADGDILSMSWDQIDKAGRLAELKNKYPEAYKQKFNETFGK